MGDTITLYTRNILETATVTVTGTPDTGYPESRLYDRAISLFWKDTVTEAKTVHVDQGASPLAVDFLAVAKHNFSGEDLQWQYSTDDFSGDVNDAVTDWTQADNAQIVKALSSALTKRYWRLTVTSMENPQCSEIFMSYGYAFSILARPGSRAGKVSNVRWNRTIGGTERSTKMGPRRRQASYPLFVDTTNLGYLRDALDDLDELRKPFYIKDHEGDYWPARLLDDPLEAFDNPNRTHVELNLIEIL